MSPVIANLSSLAHCVLDPAASRFAGGAPPSVGLDELEDGDGEPDDEEDVELPGTGGASPPPPPTHAQNASPVTIMIPANRPQLMTLPSPALRTDPSSAGHQTLPFTRDECVVQDRALSLPPVPNAAVGCGADFGFRSDSSALGVVRNIPSGNVELLHLEELRPQRGAPLVPSTTVDIFAGSARAYGARRVLADSHYAEAIRERLSLYGLTLMHAPEGIEGKVRTYLHLRELVHTRRIQFPPHPRFLSQLKAVTSKPLPGGGLSISSPRSKGGGHGDLVSAVVLAVWEARRSTTQVEVPHWVRTPHLYWGRS
jgi:hypothetical protein